jgi:hypothetical protein
MIFAKTAGLTNLCLLRFLQYIPIVIFWHLRDRARPDVIGPARNPLSISLRGGGFKWRDKRRHRRPGANRSSGVRQMIRAEPTDFVRPPVEALAQLILQHASDNLSLVKRTRARSDVQLLHPMERCPPALREQSLAPLSLPTSSELAGKQHLEDLVTIAVTSSERAEALLQSASRMHVRARQALWACTSIAVTCVGMSVFGIIGMSHDRAIANNLVNVAGPPQSSQPQQLEAESQPNAANRSIAGNQTDTAPAAQGSIHPTSVDTSGAQGMAPQQVIVVPGGNPIVATPLSPLQEATYSPHSPTNTEVEQSPSAPPPWPQPMGSASDATYSALWPTHVATARPTWIAHRRRAQVPQFITSIQRSIITLFR